MRAVHRSAVAVLTVAGLVACSDDAGAPSHDVPSASPGSVAVAGPPARDGFYIDSGYAPVRIRTEVVRVERHEKYTALRFTLTNLEAEQKWTYALFGSWVLDDGFGSFSLVDTVGRRIYWPLRAGNDSGDAFGSDGSTARLAPGATYSGVVYFPAVPAGVTRLTVMNSRNSPGVYPGVPVVAATAAPVAATAPPETPAPGSAPELKSTLPAGDIWEGSAELTNVTEGAAQETSSGPSEERIGLRTDVLFAFDKATLTAKAAGVLDAVAAETKAKADPSKPPVTITGHTDGKGEDAYNLALSERRAATIRAELEKRLGPGYRYRTEGLGETRPIAKEGGPDDERARARNRRVEISYQIKQVVPGATATASPGQQVVPGPDGTAAPPQPPPAYVAERTATVGGVGVRLRVAGFFRDGPFLVAPIEVTRDKELSPFQLVSGLFSDRPGCTGNYTDFAGLDPATGVSYLTVRIGRIPQQATDRLPSCLDGLSGGSRPDLTIASWIYLAAPPPGTATLTFDAGAFGRIPDVPIT